MRKLIDPFNTSMTAKRRHWREPDLPPFARNNANPSLNFSRRNINKATYKRFSQLWRSFDNIERINHFDTEVSRILWLVDKWKAQEVDPLVVKSLVLKIEIERSQMMGAA